MELIILSLILLHQNYRTAIATILYHSLALKTVFNRCYYLLVFALICNGLNLHPTILHAGSDWQALSSTAFSQLSATLQDWLSDSGSLTKKLQRCCQQFEVQVLSEHTVTTADLYEPFPVPLPLDCQHYFVRQVLLLCDGQPWVFASTVIPEVTLTHGNQFLTQLGNQSLGQTLFNHPDTIRSQIEYGLFSSNSGLNELTQSLALQPTHAILARRSVFELTQYPLTVTEVFLPNSPAYA